MRSRLAILLTSIAFMVLVVPSMAHQPFFEESDITADNPWQIKDPQISTAVYSMLDSPDDVDYFSFNASRGESVLLSITIPQISGQENFTPMMALIGPGLPDMDLPEKVSRMEGMGAMMLPSPENATPFYEPFSNTSYWTRQEENVTIPDIGRYLVAVWDDRGTVGKYVCVIGSREVAGGDLLFPMKMRTYWNDKNSYSQGLKASNQTQTNASSPASGQTGTRSLSGFEAALALLGMGISAACFSRLR